MSLTCFVLKLPLIPITPLSAVRCVPFKVEDTFGPTTEHTLASDYSYIASYAFAIASFLEENETMCFNDVLKSSNNSL